MNKNKMICVVSAMIVAVCGAMAQSASDAGKRKLEYDKETGLPIMPEVRLIGKYQGDKEDVELFGKWWSEMNDHDPNFARKLPMSFYARVVDQDGRPLEGAEVSLDWNAYASSEDESKRTIVTGVDGAVRAKYLRGSKLYVKVTKDGYRAGTNCRQKFAYIEPIMDDFYKPDPKNPVEFVLWDLANAEPLHRWRTEIRLRKEGREYGFTLATGKTGGTDLTFTRTTRKLEDGRIEYQVVVHAPGGLAVSDEDPLVLVNAPEGGYVNTIKWIEVGVKYADHREYKFYVIDGDGNYAAVVGRMTSIDEDRPYVSATIYYNPSGSRNLLYSPKLKIGRKVSNERPPIVPHPSVVK